MSSLATALPVAASTLASDLGSTSARRQQSARTDLASAPPAPSIRLAQKADMAGDYMWMQLIYFNSTINQKVNHAAVEHTKQTMGLVIDDGDAGARAKLGQPLMEAGNMWVSVSIGEKPDATTGTFFDQPYLDNNWAPGTQAALLDQGLTYTANFETYLMYQPQNGVWIALQEYTWSIDIGATNANFGQGNATQWAGNPDPTQPNPQATTPQGSDAFPTWTNESFGTPWTPPFT